MTHAVASQDQKFVNVRLDDGLGGVRMAGHEILHVRVAQGPCDGQDAVDAVVED